MLTDHSLEILTEKSEQYMAHLKAAKDYSFSVYQEICNTFNTCLHNRELDPLLDLLPYFNSPESYPDFIYTSEMQKVNVLLNALQLETASGKVPFLSASEDFDGLMEQYALTVFALRRLELNLSPEATEEAAAYLSSIPFNIYIAKLLIENEYFENYIQLYLNTYHYMSSHWPVSDRIPWLTWLLEKGSSETAVLELASLYMDIRRFDKAYKLLLSIQNSSAEAVSLINSLKEIIN